MDGLVAELIEGAREEMAVVASQGGAVEAVPYMKGRLVESHRARVAKIEAGELRVVGQNFQTESEDSPLTVGEDGGIMTPDPEVERERIEALEQWKAERDNDAVEAALQALAEAAADEGANLMEPTIAAADGGCDDRRVGADAARGLRRLPRPDRRRRLRHRRRRRAARRGRARPSTRPPRRSATGSRSSSPSPASTGTATAPSRSPSAPRTSAWRSSTRASA